MLLSPRTTFARYCGLRDVKLMARIAAVLMLELKELAKFLDVAGVRQDK